MNILIDIGHPAHVHLFKNIYWEFYKRGYKIFVTVKDIPAAQVLLERYKIPYFNLGSKSDSLWGKLLRQLEYDAKMFKIVKENNIDIGIGTSVTIAHISRFTKMVSIIMDDDDDDVQPMMTKLGHPFANVVLSPDALKGKRKKKNTIYYAGYHELAYLHPNRFTPDESVLFEANLKPEDTYFIMRFNAFKAHHDISARGLSLEQKLQLINLLKPFGKIFITTEREIEPELREYQFKLSPEKIHHFIYYATLFIGDSQTMTTEAAILGIPALKCNTFAGKLSVHNELENKYQLCYSYLPNEFNKMCEKIYELLKTQNLKTIWRLKRRKLLNDKIDITSFLIWFIENFPESVIKLNTNPEIQNQFK